MVNPHLLQMLATERARESAASAARHQWAGRPPRRVRQRFGRTLVALGVRIARDSNAWDSPAPGLTHPGLTHPGLSRPI